MYCDGDVTGLVHLEILLFPPASAISNKSITLLPPTLLPSQQPINWVYVILKTSNRGSF